MMWYEANGGIENFSFSLATSPYIATATKLLATDPIISIYPNPFNETTTI